MSQTLEISKEGFKLSYLRFLSDSAPGYITLLLLGAAHSSGAPMPFLGHTWLHAIPSETSPQSQIFLFVLLFLLATPIGLILNAIGWFMLGPFQIWLIRFWFWLPTEISYLVAGTRRSMHADDINLFFNLQAASHPSTQGIYEQAQFYEEVLSVYFPNYYDRLEHIRGLRRLIRSLSVLLFFVSLYCFFTLNVPRAGLLLMIGFLLLLFLNSLLEYYQCRNILFMIYILSSKLHKRQPPRDEIVENLANVKAVLGST